MRAGLANLILLLHFSYVLFVVAGLAAIWIGAWRKWRWVRNVRFRIVHLIAIVLVAVEAVLGIACPLTVWENALRGESTEGFLQHWIHKLMFFEAPSWVFAVAYLLFAALVASSWFWVPPRRMPMEPKLGAKRDL